MTTFLVTVQGQPVWSLPVEHGAPVRDIDDARRIARETVPKGVKFEVSEVAVLKARKKEKRK